MHPYNIEAILMLWAHVIIQACADVEEGIRYQLKNGRYKKSKTYSYHQDFTRRNYQNAIKWLFSEDYDFRSFYGICDIVGADAFAIREHVVQTMQNHGFIEDLRSVISAKAAA